VASSTQSVNAQTNGIISRCHAMPVDGSGLLLRARSGWSCSRLPTPPLLSWRRFPCGLWVRPSPALLLPVLSLWLIGNLIIGCGCGLLWATPTPPLLRTAAWLASHTTSPTHAQLQAELTRLLGAEHHLCTARECVMHFEQQRSSGTRSQAKQNSAGATQTESYLGHVLHEHSLCRTRFSGLAPGAGASGQALLSPATARPAVSLRARRRLATRRAGRDRAVVWRHEHLPAGEFAAITIRLGWSASHVCS
jgi:hypothetical protein